MATTAVGNCSDYEYDDSVVGDDSFDDKQSFDKVDDNVADKHWGNCAHDDSYGKIDNLESITYWDCCRHSLDGEWIAWNWLLGCFDVYFRYFHSLFDCPLFHYSADSYFFSYFSFIFLIFIHLISLQYSQKTFQLLS